MTFDEYQQQIIPYDLFDKNEWSGDLTAPAFLEKVLGIAGEAGEIEEKIKKILRDDQARLTPQTKQELSKELGDVLWYVATTARYLDIPLGDIAEANITKLQSRLERHQLSGSGDNR